MSLVHNEQTKLRATYLNGLAIATFAVGSLAPIVALLSGTSAAPPLVMVAVVVVLLRGERSATFCGDASQGLQS